MGLSKLTVWSLNANGLISNETAQDGGLGKRSTLFHMFKNNSAPYKLPDVICLQETHADSELLETIKREWPGHASGTSTSSAKLGCCILLHPKFNPEIVHETNDNDGRFNCLVFKIDEELYSIFNLYAPNTMGQPKEWQTALSHDAFVETGWSDHKACTITLSFGGESHNQSSNPTTNLLIST